MAQDLEITHIRMLAITTPHGASRRLNSVNRPRILEVLENVQ